MQSAIFTIYLMLFSPRRVSYLLTLGGGKSLRLYLHYIEVPTLFTIYSLRGVRFCRPAGVIMSLLFFVALRFGPQKWLRLSRAP